MVKPVSLQGFQGASNIPQGISSGVSLHIERIVSLLQDIAEQEQADS